MILTGKSEESFLHWYTEKYSEYNLSYKDELHLNSMIIDWFDSVGIYIDIDVSTVTNIVMFSYFISHKEYFRSTEEYWKTRSEATKAAIIKANEIYNKR